MKKVLALAICQMVNMIAYGQKTMALNTGAVIDGAHTTTPTRDVEIIDDGVIVTYHFDNMLVMEDRLYSDAKLLKIDGFGLNHHVGEPSTPQRWDAFLVPEGADYDIMVVDSTYTDIPLILSPARPLLERKPSSAFTKDNVKPIADFSGFFPVRLTPRSYLREYRGACILNVCVVPIQYNTQSGTVRAYTDLTYKVTFTTPPAVRSRKASPILSSDHFINSTVLNSPQAEIMSRTKASSPQASSLSFQEDYLIIAYAAFADAVQKLAEWKKLLGYNVHVELLQSFGVQNEIWQTIKNAYASYSNLRFVLLVGSRYQVPPYNGTDYYYSCLGGSTIGNDSTPDVAIGRLIVGTAAQANLVVDKIIGYEKEPPADQHFYNTALHSAYFEDDSYYPSHWDGMEDYRCVRTSEDIRDYVLSNTSIDSINRVYLALENITPERWSDYYADGGLMPAELRSSSFDWGEIHQEEAKIKNRIDAGSLYVFFSGHGHNECWDGFYNINDIDELSNGNHLPVVFSMACLTGNFAEGNCFAESFLNQSNGGCVSIVAATENVYVGPDDAMACAMFDAMFPSPGLRPNFGPSASGSQSYAAFAEPVYELGWMLNQSKQVMESLYGDDYRMPRVRERYCVFGDPSLKMYTEVPTYFENLTITKDNGTISVTTGGEAAVICFYDKETGASVSFMGSEASYSNAPNSMVVCVSAHNKIPHIAAFGQQVYIQNETVRGSLSFDGDVIKVGSNVTTTKSSGPVTFTDGHITLKGNSVVLEGETTVTSGTTFIVQPK